MAEGAMVEPFALACSPPAQSRIQTWRYRNWFIVAGPDRHRWTALAALAGGCAKVFISDLVDEKLGVAAQYDELNRHAAKQGCCVNLRQRRQANWVSMLCWSVSGAGHCLQDRIGRYFVLAVVPGACGMPVDPCRLTSCHAQAKENSHRNGVFANQYL